MMDAYTVKKILPRLIIAVILIQFSYYLVGIAVDITNILGKGIDALMLAPVKNMPINFDTGNDTASLTVLGGLGLGGFVALTGGLSAIAGGVGALFLLMLPALIAFIGVFFTLVFRQILIVLLAILSPVAFVAMILPGTQRFFKMWWDHLLKALMMYPLIILLLTAGTLVSVIASNVDVGSQEVGQVIAFAAIVAPLFLIPLTFKFAGTAIAAIGGGITALANRGAYGKDGKGGMTASLRERTRQNKGNVGAGLAPDNKLGSWMLRTPGLKNLTSIGGRPGVGVGSKAKSLAAVQWNRQQNEAKKDLEDSGFNNPGVLEEFVRHGRDASSLMGRARQLQRTGTVDEQKTGQELEKMAGFAGKLHYRAAAAAKAAETGKASEDSVRALMEDLQPNVGVQSQVLGSINFGAKSKNVSLSGHHVDGAGNYLGVDPGSVVDNILKRWSAEEIAGQLDLSKSGKYIEDILTGVHGSAAQDTLKDKLNQAAGMFTPPPIPGAPPPPGGGGAPPSQLTIANQQYVDSLRGRGLL